MVNEEIKEAEVRLIDNEGGLIGIMSSDEALKIAYQKNLDMVLIAPTAKPPVCKIMDYNKYIFDMAKKERENRKNQKVVNIKEVRLGLGIGEHDFQVKVKGALKFLKDGDKVKVCINRLRGRKTQLADKGVAVITQFAERMLDIADIESPVAKSGVPGRNINIMVMLAPKKKK